MCPGRRSIDCAPAALPWRASNSATPNPGSTTTATLATATSAATAAAAATGDRATSTATGHRATATAGCAPAFPDGDSHREFSWKKRCFVDFSGKGNNGVSSVEDSNLSDRIAVGVRGGSTAADKLGR
ncbi:hypothetical protein F5Y19DRAFT_480299 [Xylariaceae sp. FL1651]|nr:hypothetical protein F5Y19DRAFT_480299 [Xylariaceae sp. FL1651]